MTELLMRASLQFRYMAMISVDFPSKKNNPVLVHSRLKDSVLGIWRFLPLSFPFGYMEAQPQVGLLITWVQREEGRGNILKGHMYFLYNFTDLSGIVPACYRICFCSVLKWLRLNHVKGWYFVYIINTILYLCNIFINQLFHFFINRIGHNKHKL